MSMKEEKLFSIKDVCIRYGITRKTLFYYDRIGLLKPARREGKQAFKYYDDKALLRLESILQYRSAGLSIEEIRMIIDENDKEVILTVLMKVKDRLCEEYERKEIEIRNLDELIRINR